ncbi:MAG: M56 family metallopeptidase [Halioglobus sp.]
MHALLSSIALCALALWLLFGALGSLAYRGVRPTMRAIEPSQASNLLLVWLALPPGAALLTCYVLYSPDLAQWLVLGHCHPDTCRVHGPQATLALFPASLLAAWTLLGIGRCLLGEWLPARRLRARLIRMGDDSGEYVSLGSLQPAAFTLGWLKPRIFISTGMQCACSAKDIDCILRHERAHRLRFDNLRLLLARFFTAPLPRRWSRQALDDLRLCCEKACDLSAAAHSSRATVASTLLRVATLQQKAAPSTSCAFAGNQTEQRILALLDEPQVPLAGEKLFAASSLTLLLILALINPLHRAIELLP